MDVTVKLYGRFLEEQVYKLKKRGVKISNDEITVSLKENSSLSDLLKVLEIPEQTAIMCLINEKIPYFDDKLSDGDKVEIILLVDGG